MTEDITDRQKHQTHDSGHNREAEPSIKHMTEDINYYYFLGFIFYIPIYIFLVTVSYDILAIVCLNLRCVSECMYVSMCIYVYLCIYVCMYDVRHDIQIPCTRYVK